MIKMRTTISALVLLVLTASTSTLAISCKELWNTNTSDYIERFNQYRQEHRLPPLVFTDDLNEVAQLRLEELKTDYSHDSLGSYNEHLAENIVKGVSNNRDALSTWDKSQGHKANMLDSSYKYSGYAAGGGFAVQVFTQYPTVDGEPQLPPGWRW